MGRWLLLDAAGGLPQQRRLLGEPYWVSRSAATAVGMFQGMFSPCGAAEVDELDVARRVEQDVLGLEVAEEDFERVQVLQGQADRRTCSPVIYRPRDMDTSSLLRADVRVAASHIHNLHRSR